MLGLRPAHRLSRKSRTRLLHVSNLGGASAKGVSGDCAQSGMAEMSEKFKGVGAEVYLDEAAVAS